MWGKTPGQLVRCGVQDPQFWAAFWKMLTAKHSWRGEVVNRNKQGERFVITQSVTPILADDGSITHFIAVQEDITEKKASLEQMEYMATHDRDHGFTGQPAMPWASAVGRAARAFWATARVARPTYVCNLPAKAPLF
jgi:hypothetical protein